MGLLLLVRHGQASFGADDYDVLSPTGWEQGRLLGASLAAAGALPTALVRGSMRRHRETLEALVDGAGRGSGDTGTPEPPGTPGTPEAPGVTVDAGWDEFDHLGVVGAHPDLLGDDAWSDRRAFQTAFVEATRRWTAGEPGADGAAYPESWGEFLGRVRGALTAAAAATGSGGTTLVVTSGGAIAAACAALVDPEETDEARLARAWSRFNTVCVNTGVTRVVVGSTGPRLLTFNEHPHVSGDTLTYR
ncbi:histidine phosphatase family protein [Nocardioides sp. Leaf307]|uniref:histidine phosphatase family protein n=1 Tax=Nocardioides sp. Leaf307 TaxID=1736331 RepID=UPI0007024A0E|nr:histidine phosphatase family protein [Nocardioides sp. Leaf307]KQQ39469.1 hypothetical protein ASF50_16225 [Nocardioides sp. Leaf307]